MCRSLAAPRALLSLAILLAAAAAAEAQSVQLGGNASYHQGDESSLCPTVTVTCGGGIWNSTNNIRLIIPPGLNLEWDQTIGTASCNGDAQSSGHISATPSVTYASSKIAIVHLVSGHTFGIGQVANISGLRFMNFGAPSSGSIGGSSSGGTTATFISGQTMFIVGNPTVDSGTDQDISGPGPVTANTITITDATLFPPGIWGSKGLRITIPPSGIGGLNMEWDSSVGTVGISMTGTGSVNPNPTYSLDKKTVIFSVTDFGSGASVQISGLKFTTIGVDSGPLPLTVTTNGGPLAGRTGNQSTDLHTKRVHGLPTIDSGSAQIFTKGDPTANANPITITESSGTPKIAAPSFRITIPAGFNMTWDATVLAPNVTVGGTAGTGKIAANPAVSYTNGNRTVIIPVISAFGSNDTAVIGGLKFTGFAAGSVSNRLQLDIDNDGVADSIDAQTIVISAPTITSTGNQVFQVGDGVTNANTFTITDGNPSVTTAAKDLRIKIPAGFNMEWDTTRTGPALLTFGGTAAAAATGTITYESTQIARINLNGPLGAGQTLTIAGMRYQNFSNPSTPNNIQLEVNNQGTNCNNTAPFFVAVGGAPKISSAANQSFTVNDSATGAQVITVTDANGFPSITTATGVRIQIPVGFNMTWNTSIVSLAAGNFTGSAGAKIAAPPNNVSYPDSHTALIKVATNFNAGDVVNISGLAFQSFSAPSAPANLDLVVNGVGVADDKTIGVGQPLIGLAGIQNFGTSDPPTVLETVTVTEDASVPRVRAVNGVVIRLPNALSLDCIFDTSITTTGQGLSFTGSGAGHVTAAATKVSYPNNRTAVIALQSDFLAGEILMVDGLTLTNFNSATGPSVLGLSVNASPFGVCSTTGSLLSIGVRPKLVSAKTADTNGNGSIDHLILTYDKNINGTTSSATTGLGFSIVSPGYTIGGGSVAGAVVTFTLVEKGTPDTGVTPSVLYDATVGNLQDLTGLTAGNTSTPLLSTDGAPPVAMSVSKLDANGNGHLDSFTIVFSEDLKPGQEDAGDWKLIDANGTSDLLQGLVSIVIANNTVTFNLADSFGTAGTPTYLYTPDGDALKIQDNVTPTSNVTLVQTNAGVPNIVLGGDQAVGPSKVFLDASRSTDPNGQPLTFLWAAPGGITLSDPTSARPFFIGKAAGTFTFTCTVSNLLVSATATTHVTILNVPPSVDVGANQTLNPGQFFDLVALATSDSNGQPPFLTYLWTQIPTNQGGGKAQPIGGATSVVAGGTAVTPTAAGVGPPDNILKFRLDVSDGTNTSSAFTFIRLNSPTAVAPTADAGPDKVAFVNTKVTLDGSLSSNPSGGTLTYQWSTTLPGAQFNNGTTATPDFTPTLPGIYKFTLTVVNTTTNLASFPSTTTVLVHSPSNQAPVAAAHRIQPGGEIVAGDLVVLDGTGSVDPEGGALTYAWVQTAGPKVILDDPSSIRPGFTPVTAALYTFELTVSDGVNQSLPVPVSITVKNTPANVTYQATLLPWTGVSNGHATGNFQLMAVTNEPNTNNNYYYYLEQLEGPTAGINTVVSNFGPLECCQSTMLNQPYDITPSASGTYKFRLYATTLNELIRALAETTVVVDLGGVTVPTATAVAPATAAAGQTVTLTGSSLSGTNFYWTQVEGPPLTMSDPNSASPTVTPIAGGQYTFALTVSDGVSTSPPSLVVMSVTPATSSTSSGGGSGGGGCGFLGLEGVLLLPLVWAVSALRSRRVAVRAR